jgi:hypothetical protein
MTATVLDTSTIESLDFDIVCDYDNCDTAARWTETHLCCHVQFILCVEHKNQVLDFIKMVQNDSRGWDITCFGCNGPLKVEQIILTEM